MQTGLEKNLFGNHAVSLPAAESRVPPAFASDPLMPISATGGREKHNASSLDSLKDPSLPSSVAKEYSPMTGMGLSKLSTSDIVEIDDPSSVGNQFTSEEPNFMKATSPVGVGGHLY